MNGNISEKSGYSRHRKRHASAVFHLDRPTSCQSHCNVQPSRSHISLHFVNAMRLFCLFKKQGNSLDS
ncbi:hypothetical protein AOLI_G00138450 [Acnodon oligacanthus]